MSYNLRILQGCNIDKAKYKKGICGQNKSRYTQIGINNLYLTFHVAKSERAEKWS